MKSRSRKLHCEVFCVSYDGQTFMKIKVKWS